MDWVDYCSGIGIENHINFPPLPSGYLKKPLHLRALFKSYLRTNLKLTKRYNLPVNNINIRSRMSITVIDLM